MACLKKHQKERQPLLQMQEPGLTFFSGHEISKAYSGEGDDHEVDGLQRAPAFNVLEDDGWQGHEGEAAEQQEEHC